MRLISFLLRTRSSSALLFVSSRLLIPAASEMIAAQYPGQKSNKLKTADSLHSQTS